jgi:magnesium-transporting ATPase (P-type)
MRCLNYCPEKAIEAAHGMAIAFWIIFSAINAQLILLIINTLKINPDIWWWKLVSQVAGIACMIIITTVLYRIMHHAMGFSPVRYLVRYTSLTTLPFWIRYSFLKNSKKSRNS